VPSRVQERDGPFHDQEYISLHSNTSSRASALTDLVSNVPCDCVLESSKLRFEKGSGSTGGHCWNGYGSTPKTRTDGVGVEARVEGISCVPSFRLRIKKMMRTTRASTINVVAAEMPPMAPKLRLIKK
jgi:hypothetical protein